MANRSNRQVTNMQAWKTKPVCVTGCEWIANAVKNKALIRLVRLIFCYSLLIPLANAGNEQHFVFDIPQQRADVALRALANQADLSVMFDYDAISQHQANALSGSYAVKKAVELLLAGTGLGYEFDSSGHLIITKNSDFDGEDVMGGLKSKKQLLASVIAMFAGSAGVQGALAQDEVVGDEGWLLEEVVVTATKRKDVSVQDTAMTISVLDSEDIGKRNLVGMKDYLATVPGVAYNEFSPGNNRIFIRGLSMGSGDTQGTVGVYFGEMPLSTAGREIVDLKLVDIERVELLKGPQGTLYGSSSLAGAVRNIPSKPVINEYEAEINLNVSSQSESSDLNRSLAGVVNFPLVGDRLAMRVVAYQYINAGYIDSISTPEQKAEAAETGNEALIENDLGENSFTGGRASLVWRPGDKLNVELMLGVQRIDEDGPTDVITDLGGYRTSYINTPNGGFNKLIDTTYANLLVEYDFNWFDLTSSTSFVENEGFRDRNQFTAGGLSFGSFNAIQDGGVEMFSQELRIATTLGDAWEFVAGIFYEDVVELDRFTIFSRENDEVSGPFSDAEVKVDYTQWASFGEVSYQFNDKWSFTFGGRYFSYDREDSTEWLNDAPWNGVGSKVNAGESGTVAKANISHFLNEDVLIYAQWSQGFRLGKGQILPSKTLCDVDNDGKLDFTEGRLVNEIGPDETDNIELGVKSTLRDGRLIVNASAFRIDWSNIPLTFFDTTDLCPSTTRITNNIGEARSQGVEMEFKYLITPALSMNLSASYTDPEWLIDPIGPIQKGDRLTLTPFVNSTVGMEYRFDLYENPAFFRTDISYVGEFELSERGSSLPRPPAGDYVDVSIRAGLEIQSLSMAVYASNLTNENAILLAERSSALYRVRPRQIGLDFSYNF